MDDLSTEDRPASLPDLPSALCELQEDLRKWAGELGMDSYYVDHARDDIGPNDFGYWLRTHTEDNLRKAVSILEVTKGPEFARALEDRFRKLYADAEAYDKLLVDLEDKCHAEIRRLKEEYRQKVGTDEAALWRARQGPNRVFSMYIPDEAYLDAGESPPDRTPMTVEAFAEAIDCAVWEERYSKCHAQCEMQKAATDLADHVGVVEASLPSSPPPSPAVAQSGQSTVGGRMRKIADCAAKAVLAFEPSEDNKAELDLQATTDIRTLIMCLRQLGQTKACANIAFVYDTFVHAARYRVYGETIYNNESGEEQHNRLTRDEPEPDFVDMQSILAARLRSLELLALADSQDPGQVVGQSQGEATAVVQQKGGKRISKDEANVRARFILERNPDISANDMASEIDCSRSLIYNLPVWQAVQEQREKGRKPKTPKAVSMTDKMQESLGEGEKDQVLNDLIKAQQADGKSDGSIDPYKNQGKPKFIPRRKP